MHSSFLYRSKVPSMTTPQSSKCLASLLAPEPIQQILSRFTLPHVAAAALSCQGWKEVALDILWNDVNLINLLNVLAPTEVRDEERLSGYCPVLRSDRFLSDRHSISCERLLPTISHGFTTWLSGFGQESFTVFCMPGCWPRPSCRARTAPRFSLRSLLSSCEPT